MTWRFQPVWIEDTGEKIFSLCEVYFDDDLKLESWTESRDISPQGDDLDDLTEELAHMLVSAYRWEPVNFANLKVGMTFKKAILSEQAESLAKIAEAMDHNMHEAARS